MTGFGEAIAENERYRIGVTLRTVNHRFLDLVVRLPEEHRSLETQVSELARGAVAAALEQAIAAREHEGDNLRRVLLSRVEELRVLLAGLESRRAEVAGEMRSALEDRIAALLGDAGIPEERLAQEAVLLVERSDVREELDRLSAHLDHFRTLADGDGPHGRRLEFLVQEIQRELNTLGGKCRDAEMTRDVVDGKLLCEQLREQLLNVE